jgi:ATP-dependent RNA helicase SUPV3L1/SUV3
MASMKPTANLTVITDDEWQPLRDQLGDTLRKGAKVRGNSIREQVIARTYTLNGALSLFQIRKPAMESALAAGLLHPLTDPEGQIRFTAREVDRIMADPQALERIHEHERVYLDDIANLMDISVKDLRRRLTQVGIDNPRPTWGEVKPHLNLSVKTLAELREAVIQRKAAKRDAVRTSRRDRREREREEQRAALEQKRLLRQKLLDAFPAWRHDNRGDQLITLHVGPPNSGKTHDAIRALEDAGSGWYLAPLRLLAYEVFDRLNQRGTPCNLLTGEEYIPIPGATITAATIEMFNSQRSGDVVVIDEAQMLADADRGWAWTRALMDANAPDIHVIAPSYAQTLILNLADAAGIDLEIVEHQRLSPIRIADTPWSLQDLPPKTILIAFSRAAVLDLKMTLEDMGRDVSIIYGSLPPEVRRKQSDRFANGETDVCVATDAVGMGLNLPADHVCFYELEKFDGRTVRLLTAAEVQQIGGRAGRFGFADTGIVGALSKRDLRLLRRLFYDSPPELTHARVAPTVDDLALLPGHLSERLIQWAELQSIPESLRDKVRIADLSERIELAKMLSDKEVEYLGLETALRLVNAPTNRVSRAYWRDCATSIITAFRMPLPDFPPTEINDSNDLEATEEAIAKADIYLWLSCREEFAHYAPEHVTVRALRNQWSIRIDDALVNKLKVRRQCKQCGRPLPLQYRFRICDHCYNHASNGTH